MANLVTPEQVSDITGASVSATDIAAAQLVIETITGRDLSSEEPEKRFRAGDLRRLKTAVIWQVTYLDSNPDVLQAVSNVASVSANGVSVSYVQGGAAGPVEGFLAPLAASALGQMSWNKRYSTKFARPYGTKTSVQTLVEDGDDSDWRPL